MRILIVEDFAGIRGFLKRVLGDRHQVTAAADIASAKLAAGSEKFDLVISDNNLPDGFGFNFLETLAATTQSPPLMMLMSDSSPWGDNVTDQPAFIVKFLRKPQDLVRVEEFVQVVERHLEQAKI